MNLNYKALVGALAGLAMFTTAASAAQITGAGSTFVNPILTKWSSSYKAAPGSTTINYQSIGSGGGIAQIKAKTVTFGATDKPLATGDLNASGLIQFPLVIGGIVPVVNVPGIKSGQLVLDGPTLADIFLGKIKSWSDPAIKKLNPGVNLPSTAIAVVHRADGSGTTFNFATYLSDVSREWKSSVGADTAIDWPTGIGAKGNDGVAGNVQQVAGTIGYVEYAYAKQNHLTYVKMVNHAGKTVEPETDSFRAAAASADWAGAAKNGFYILFVDSPGATAWPISATTFVLIYKDPPDKAGTADALKFFKWSLEKGEQDALSLDYVPLPDNAVKAIEASWKQVQGSGM